MTERYCLACRSDAMQEPALAEFLAILRGEEFSAIVTALPGYGNGITGMVFGVEDAFSAAPRPATPRPAIRPQSPSR